MNGYFLKYAVSVLCIICLCSIVLSQPQNVPFDKSVFKDDKEGFKDAMDNLLDGNDYFTDSSYALALKYYLLANNFNPDNAELNYKIGVCYLNEVNPSKALEHFQKSFKLDRELNKDIRYRLGQSYQALMQYDKAIEEYNEFKISLSPNVLYNWYPKLQKRFAECNSGKELMKRPTGGIIVSLKEVNSEFPEYCPLISADESMMIFTSRRSGSTGNMQDPHSMEYYEDIYISYNRNGKWSEPENIGRPVNTDNHDATVGLSPDGQELYIYQGIKGKGDIDPGDLYVCELKGSEWSMPKPLPKSINSPYREFSASISFDGRTLFFTSNRSGGFGGRDIYVSTREPNGEWGQASNIGNTVNTEEDEEGVFAHPDGKTLYFSSKGHNSMGGYDIFKTVKDNSGKWTKPENIGYPVNTAGDDVFFVTSADGRHGYFSSLKKEGMGSTDLYMINFTQVEGADEGTYVTLVKGIVKDVKNGKAIEAEIEIVDNEKDEVISVFNSNSNSGEYLVSLPSGKNYGIAVKANGYLFHSENFNLPLTKKFDQVVLNIELNPIEEGSVIILKNLFFDYAKAELKSESISELNRVVKILQDNPMMRIEIGGHTDNASSLATNQRLSTDRAKAVVDYLTGKGIDSKRLEFKGYAFYQPIASNDTEEGRAKNRRVEFKILSK